MNKERWKALMAALGLNSAFDCYQLLHTAYSEPHRFYHTAQHVEAMLQHLDSVIDLVERPAELELAIWFHDAVYKILSKTNELDSAKWAKEFLISQGYNTQGIERVYHLIMATLHNRPDGQVQSHDENLIVDIDLTILGAASGVYDEFERNVRKEYKIVPYFLYRKKRKALLKAFLNHSHIYHLNYFRDKYENIARQNINRAIERL